MGAGGRPVLHPHRITGADAWRATFILIMALAMVFTRPRDGSAGTPAGGQHAAPGVECDDGMRRQVLVVDDDPRVRAALRDLLATTDDFAVTAEAGTAPEAPVVTDSVRRVEVALVDIGLPDLETGLEALDADVHPAP
jgi:hypothetical protein